LHKSLNMV